MAQAFPSLDAESLAPYRDLRRRRRGPRFVVEGELAAARLLQSRHAWTLHSLLGTRERLARLEPLVRERCPVIEATHAQLRELTGFDFHRGVLAAAERQTRWGLPETLRHEADSLTIVVAHGIADPPNLGAIARNARALGAKLWCVDARAADPFAAKAIRASAGQLFDLPTLIYDSLDELHALLAQLDCRLWAAALGPASRSIDEALRERPARVAIAIGNEGQGLDDAFLARCDARVQIAMDGGVDSLNAAASSAVLLHALRLSGDHFLPK